MHNEPALQFIQILAPVNASAVILVFSIPCSIELQPVRLQPLARAPPLPGAASAGFGRCFRILTRNLVILHHRPFRGDSRIVARFRQLDGLCPEAVPSPIGLEGNGCVVCGVMPPHVRLCGSVGVVVAWRGVRVPKPEADKQS